MTASEEQTAGIGHNSGLPENRTDVLRRDFAGLMDEVESLAGKAQAIRDGLNQKGEITTDEERDAFVEIGVSSNKLAKRVDGTRTDTTKPLRDEVDEINKFFNVMKLRAEKIKQVFEGYISAYDRKIREEERRRAAAAAHAAQQEAERRMAEAVASKHSIEGDVIINEAAEADNRARRLAAQATGAGTGPTRTEAGTISATKSWTFIVEDWKKIDPMELWDQFSVAEVEKAIRAHVRKHKDTRPLKGVRIFPEEKTRLRG